MGIFFSRRGSRISRYLIYDIITGKQWNTNLRFWLWCKKLLYVTTVICVNEYIQNWNLFIFFVDAIWTVCLSSMIYIFFTSPKFRYMFPYIFKQPITQQLWNDRWFIQFYRDKGVSLVFYFKYCSILWKLLHM